MVVSFLWVAGLGRFGMGDFRDVGDFGRFRGISGTQGISVNFGGFRGFWGISGFEVSLTLARARGGFWDLQKAVRFVRTSLADCTLE